ncbi:MAG: O-antigen ligase family protein [Patescibacteria group bacterium]|jgi:O-antigen ligase/tetratricopeptide (TPR) repeat protein
MSAKTYLRILQGGILVSLMIIFFVFKDLLFPFITSKQLSFNILMELLLVVLVVLWLRYPAYRPKRSFITYGLLAYFLTILASCAVSVDISLSFWGDAERMLGLFHLAHFFIFYLIIITAFRSWRDWQVLFLSSVAVATVVSLIGLFGESPYSTIGNTAYVSAYLIFNLYFIILLFFRSSQKGARWLYLLPFGVLIAQFVRMKTSGAIIGFGLSLLILILLLGLAHQRRLLRRLSLGVFVLAVAVLAFVFSQTQATWFQNSFLRNLTSQKVTFQTRLVSWEAAIKDLPNHFLFGNGFGNYADTFDRHFDSRFYNYTTGDTYFDRAHNNVIEVLSTTGVLGLLTYLSIFIAALYYLYREFRANGRRVSGAANGLNNLEVIVVLTLIIAYFIQNLAIFDSYTTFLGLMMTLGFVYWLNYRRHYPLVPEAKEGIIKSERGELWVLVSLGIVMLIFTNYYNIKTLKMFRGTIQGYAQIISGDLATGIDTYQKYLVGRPLEKDARVTLINLIASNPSLLNRVNAVRAEEIMDYVISLAEKNVSYNPLDSMRQMQLAQILNTAALLNISEIDKFNEYSRPAMQAIEKSIEASPGRATVYFIKAQMQLARNEIEEAIETFDYGIALNPAYGEGYCRLVQAILVAEVSEEYSEKLEESIDKCLSPDYPNNGLSEYTLKLLANYYSERLDFKQAAELSLRLAETNDQDAEIWINVARLNYVIGEQELAEEAAKRAQLLDPQSAADWLEFKAYVEENLEQFIEQ